MSNLIIKNVKVKKDKVIANYVEEIEVEDRYVNVRHKIESDHLPHPDFVNAMEVLKPHFAIICDCVKTSDLDKVKPDDLKVLKITGFSLSGQDEAEGVVLKGMKRAKNGQFYAFNSPLIHFQTSDEYKGAGELYADVQTAVEEFKQYLGGKHGDPLQTEIDFEATPEEEAFFRQA